MQSQKHPLAAWREARNLTQKAAAEELGIGRWMVNSIEVGRRQPSPDLAKVIESKTGISWRELLPDLAAKLGSAA